ncbi:hypothetical protein AB0L00_38550 [Actinoallomurus sp. NPDC052308]|uniref:hypothetical protein n=1 Tax=Actinoallomurus sp. NPDC052308 TaxID=3155530 RepID=UPI003434FF19
MAEREMASVPDGRAPHARLLLRIARLLVSRQRGNLAAEAQGAQRLQAMAAAPEAAQPALGEDLRALALISLGYAQGWTAPLARAAHLEQGIALARRIGRPYLEFTGLAYQAAIEATRSLPGAEQHARRAIELAERHGWTDETESSRSSPTSASTNASARESASPRRSCASPKATPTPRSPPSWTPPRRRPGRPGSSGHSCCRPSPPRRSAIPTPPVAPSNGRWSAPSPAAHCCGSSCIPSRTCWNSTPGGTPRTPPWSPRSARCSPATPPSRHPARPRRRPSR